MAGRGWDEKRYRAAATLSIPNPKTKKKIHRKRRVSAREDEKSENKGQIDGFNGAVGGLND